MKAFRSDEELEKRAKYLAVLQMSDHVQLCYWPSTVAAALVILASLEGDNNASRQRVIEVLILPRERASFDCNHIFAWVFPMKLNEI